jgi:hypothetical protein
MEIEYDLTEEDLVAFLRYMRAHPSTPGGGVQKRSNPWLLILFLLLLGGAAVIAYVNTPGILGGPGGYFLSFALGCVVTLFFIRSKASPRAFVRQALKDEPLAFQDLRFTLSPQGVTQSSFFGAHTRYWRGVRRIAATADHVFFYISKTVAFCVPNRAFASERDFQVFVETARRYHAEALSPADAFSGRANRDELARRNDPPDPGITR